MMEINDRQTKSFLNYMYNNIEKNFRIADLPQKSCPGGTWAY